MAYTANGDICNISVGQTYTYSYTGAAQTFTAPCEGNYKVELWGAQGGTSRRGSKIGGYGGYTAGTLSVAKNSAFYVYVGQVGTYNSGYNSYNGGGYGGETTGEAKYEGSGGGGATDIRVVSGVWNNADSLRSRIMVAAGGGGGAYETANPTTWYALGGKAGGLTGYIATGMTTNAQSHYGTGGSQTAAGTSVNGKNGGGFGYGGDSYSLSAGAGGGGGWYGGGATSNTSGGGGGSSYISGHTGSVAVASITSSSPKSGCSTSTTSNPCSITPYINSFTNAGYTFTNTVMIDGAGYAWTNAKGSLQIMPKPTGGNYSSGYGHTGSGYAKITFVGR